MHSIVNQIVAKFSRRAKFTDLANTYVEFQLSWHTYNVDEDGYVFEVLQTPDPDINELRRTAFAVWVESVLAGKTRDDSGVLA